MTTPGSMLTSHKFEYAVIQFGYTERLLERGRPFEGPFEKLTDLRHVQIRERAEPDAPTPRAEVYPDASMELLYVAADTGEYHRDEESECIVDAIRGVLPHGTSDCVIVRARYWDNVLAYIAQVDKLAHCNSFGIDNVQYATSAAGHTIVHIHIDSESG